MKRTIKHDSKLYAYNKRKGTNNDSSWKNLTTAIGVFLKDLSKPGGSLSKPHTCPGHQHGPSFTQTMSPSECVTSVGSSMTGLCVHICKRDKPSHLHRGAVKLHNVKCDIWRRRRRGAEGSGGTPRAAGNDRRRPRRNTRGDNEGVD